MEKAALIATHILAFLVTAASSLVTILAGIATALMGLGSIIMVVLLVAIVCGLPIWILGLLF